MAKSTTLTPAQRVLRAKLAAHEMHAHHDPHTTTVAAREAFRKQFEVKVDPEGVLPLAERQRRAEHARKAHYMRMALQSARARCVAKEADNGQHAN